MTGHLKAHIGARIREARQSKGMTQAEVAARLGKAVETISNVERGATWTSLETLERMSLLFGERVEFFFEGYSMTDAKSSSRLRIEAEVTKLVSRLGDRDIEVVRDVAVSLERQSKSS